MLLQKMIQRWSLFPPPPLSICPSITPSSWILRNLPTWSPPQCLSASPCASSADGGRTCCCCCCLRRRRQKDLAPPSLSWKNQSCSALHSLPLLLLLLFQSHSHRALSSPHSKPSAVEGCISSHRDSPSVVVELAESHCFPSLLYRRRHF